jgi:cytochrome c oxidase subunit II
VPALILIGLFGISVTRLGELSQIPTDPNTLRIAVTGRQFSWEFDYGTTGVKSTNELRIPTGRPLVFEVTSLDVIHSFWVPDLYGKIDANPGRINRISFSARQPGTYRGVCAELCGAGHANMLFRVEAMPPAEYEQWIEQQRSGAPPPAPGGAGDPNQGRTLVSQKGCGTCHVIPGVQGATGTVGPSLAGVAGRTRIAGGAVPNTSPDELKAWIMNPPALKPGTLMPNLGLSDAEATNIVAFLQTLR